MLQKRSFFQDLEWLIGSNEDKDMEVTITYLPEMNLTSQVADGSEITWLQEIHETEALAHLDKELYKFKQVFSVVISLAVCLFV